MDRGRNIAGGGFGRRGSQVLEVPPTAARAAPSKPPVVDHDEATKPPALLRLASLIALALLALVSLEAMFSSTSLITPINDTFLSVMRGIGFIVGIPVSLLVIMKPHVPMGIFKKLLMILFMPVLIGFVAGEFAWRIADRMEFGFFSSAPFSPAYYPITSESFGRKGSRDSFTIDPFDLKDGTEIAVPSAQYEAIWLHSSDYCIQVMQRRSASGAIEILNDGVFTLSEPAPATLTLCPEAQLARERRDEEYRRQRAQSHH